jgi:hypothetical protein
MTIQTIPDLCHMVYLLEIHYNHMVQDCLNWPVIDFIEAS